MNAKKISGIINIWLGIILISAVSTGTLANCRATYAREVHKPIQIYVDAVKGDDRNTGKKSSPIQTLYRAQEIVRSVAKNAGNDIIVYLKGGVYNLTKTLTFDGAQDFIPTGKRITFKNYKNDKVYISGGLPLSEWVVSGMGEDIVKTTVPDDFYTRDLYVNGKPAVRARTPVLIKEGLMWPDIGREITYKDGGKLGQAANAGDMEVVFNYQWCVHRVGVTSAGVRNNNSVLTLDSLAHYLLTNTSDIGPADLYGTKNIWYIENSLALLTEPGEWYYDKSAKTIYYKLRAGEKANSIIAHAGFIEMLISNNSDKTLKNITFEGLTFCNTTWTQPEKPEGYITVQAGFYKTPDTTPQTRGDMAKWQRPHAAIRLVNTDGIEFINNEFINLGNGGIDMEWAKNARIAGNLFTGCGGTAILLGGFISMEDHHPDNDIKITENIEVSNNYIHNICTNMQSACGVAIGYSRNVMFTHNTVHDVPYTGLSYGWGWGGFDTQYETIAKGGHIAYNHIYNTTQDVIDGGAIYTLSQRDGLVIEYNYVHHNPKWFGGIYLDNSSAGYIIRHNVLHNNAYNFLLTCYNTEVYDNYLDDPDHQDDFSIPNVNPEPGKNVMFIGFKDREGNLIGNSYGWDGVVYVLKEAEWKTLNNTYTLPCGTTEAKRKEIIASCGVEPMYRARFGIK